jgi:uroporphyrinogen III methyltransferase/synthase
VRIGVIEGALQGVRVLVTRPRAQADAFARLLEESGATVLVLPTVEIVEPEDWSAADDALRRLADYRMLIFTSANGVDRFLARLEEQGQSRQALRQMQCVAIGPATADAARASGLSVGIVPQEYRAEGVVQAVSEALGDHLEGLRILLPRALKAREVLPRELRKLGAKVDVVPVYRSVVPQGAGRRLRECLEEGVDLATFTSSSTVHNFARLVEQEGLGPRLQEVVVACIGPITADTATANGLDVSILPGEYTVEALHQAVVEHFSATPR